MTATPPAARARAPGRPRPRDRAPVPEGLREGRHGPHRVRWDARAGVWIVTAPHKASLDLLGFGASVHFQDGTWARIVAASRPTRYDLWKATRITDPVVAWRRRCRVI